MADKPAPRPRTLKAPPEAAPPKRTRAEWDELIRRREQLDAERKEHARVAAALQKDVEKLDGELAAFVEGETDGDQQVLKLKHFILSIVWAPPAPISLAFAAWGELKKKLGEAAAVDAMTAIAGKKKKVDIQWRDEAAVRQPAA